MVGDVRRGRDQVGDVGILGVEEPQRVRRQALALDAHESIRMGREVGAHGVVVGRAAGRVADRVEEHLHVGQARLAVEAVPQLDDLGVHGRPRVADGLDVPLPELAEAAGLRAVVAEHRAEERDPHRLRPRLESVLDVGAHDARRRLRAERPSFGVLSPAGADAEQLLLDDVRGGADAAFEDVALLEKRRLHRGVAVPSREVAGDRLEALPRRALVGEQVARAARGAVGGHAGKSSEWRRPDVARHAARHVLVAAGAPEPPLLSTLRDEKPGIGPLGGPRTA